MNSLSRCLTVAVVIVVATPLFAVCDDGKEMPVPTSTVDLQNLSPEQVYALLAQAVRRPGFVLHSTLRAGEPTGDGGQAPYYTKEFWIDGGREALREEFHLDPSRESYDMATEGLIIIVGNYIYVPDDPDEALRFDVEDFCPGTDNAIVSRLLECGGEGAGGGSPQFERAPAPRIETAAEYNGRAAIALALETGDRPFSGANPAKVRIYLDRDTFLPLARVVEWSYADRGEPFVAYVSEYEHEFIKAGAVDPSLLDPHSIGYGVEDAAVAVDEIAKEIPVYWLGEEFQPEGGFDPLVLTNVFTNTDVTRWPQSAPFGGLSGTLRYETPRGLSGVSLLLWRPAELAAFMQTVAGAFLSDSSCAQREDKAINGKSVTIYTMPQLRYPLGDLGPCAGRVAVPPWTDPPVIAFMDFGEVVVDVRPEVTGDYDTLDAVEAILRGVRPLQE